MASETNCCNCCTLVGSQVHLEKNLCLIKWKKRFLLLKRTFPKIEGSAMSEVMQISNLRHGMITSLLSLENIDF